MLELNEKIRRQMEILWLVMNKTPDTVLQYGDIAEKYSVEILTVKRDLNDLRSYGIQIHSQRQKGIVLIQPLNENILKSLIVQYAGFHFTEHSLDRSTSLLIQKLGQKAFCFIVSLQQCINKNLVAKINYHNSSAEDGFDVKYLHPLLVFQNEGKWRLLAYENNQLKQFHIEKISEVFITEEKFTRPEQDFIPSLFRNSWRSWIGEEVIKVKLYFTPIAARWIAPRIWIGSQKLYPQADGSLIFEATVNTLSEMTSFVLSQGKECIVLEPVELKESVLKIAHDILLNYQ